MSFSFKKFLKGVGLLFIICYLLFLISPIIVSPILNSYKETIVDTAKTVSGLDVNIDKIGLTTKWNMYAGVKLHGIQVKVPASEKPVFSADKVSIRLALLPLIIKKIQLGDISAKNVQANFDVKKDGNFLFLDYIPQDNSQEKEPFNLPFGLTLSNNLPNVIVSKYNVSVTDLATSKEYSVVGNNFKLSEFVLDKNFMLKTNGEIVFDGNIVSNFDIDIFNKIMPNLVLQDLVFPNSILTEDVSSDASTKKDLPQFDVIQLFNVFVNNKFSADLNTKLKIDGSLKDPILKGNINICNLTVAVDGNNLPKGYISTKFKDNVASIDSILYTSNDKMENTQIIGTVKSGKRPSINLTFRSNAKINNVINLIDSIAKTFGIDDFSTLSATGQFDADFNINSDLKKVSSNGYLKILPANISYGLYNIVIDNIRANVNFDNNVVKINDAGFSIFGHPLSVSGSITQDASVNLKLLANSLSVKGLLLTLGQVSILKDNNITSGDLSLSVLLKGKLYQLKPELATTINSLKLFNKSSSMNVNLDKLQVKANYDGKTILGDVDLFNLLLKQNNSIVKVPETCILMDDKNIKINKAYALLNNSRIDITGGINDYISDKLSIDLKAKGKLNSTDVVSFLPKDFVSLISYKGALPLTINVNGNTKVQNIAIDLSADKNNYISLIDIDKLKNKPTKITSNIEVLGETVSLSNTKISNGDTVLAKLTGEITKIYNSPKLNISIDVPNQLSFPIWGVPMSNISANGSVVLGGSLEKPTMKGTLNVSDISIKDLDFMISDLVAVLSGDIINGTATARKFKVGGILAEDLSAKFALKDYSIFSLTDIVGKAFEGTIKGKLFYNVNNSKIGLDLVGDKMNSTKAIYGAVGIKDALTGVMNFSTKLFMQGVTDVEIIKSMTGNLTFNISDGRFVSIGKLENLVAAQNVTTNSILKAAISALSIASTAQESDKFKSITGEMNFSKGNANISRILVSGSLMSYYVSGVYNILQNTATLTVLGRLDARVVSSLGVIGELSVDKLLSYIPKLGSLTSNLLNQLTSDPKNENTSLIPNLTNGSTSYKDFKVYVNGSVSSASAVKYFKWLSTCDTSKMSIKTDLQGAKEAVKDNITNRVETTKNTVSNVKTNVSNIVETQKNNVQNAKMNYEQTKANIQNTKETAKQTAGNLKNVFQNAVKNSQTKIQQEAVEQAVEVPEGGE